MLANRLKRVMGRIVSDPQNAFVEGRLILNAFLIANEVFDFWQKGKDKGLVCKLDIEKAFDSINWQFLKKVMQGMGFGPKWMRWIWWCISTAKFSVLVNGVSACIFSISRGLRQGDSLSPYLFIIGMEVLIILLRRAVARGFIAGYIFRGREGAAFNISHLLFVDDTIIFSKASEDQICYLIWVLFYLKPLLV